MAYNGLKRLKSDLFCPQKGPWIVTPKKCPRKDELGGCILKALRKTSCDIVDHLQGSFGPFGLKSENSLEKGSRGLFAPGAQKV